MARQIKDFLPQPNSESPAFGYWIFETDGATAGCDLEHWLETEAQAVVEWQEVDISFPAVFHSEVKWKE